MSHMEELDSDKEYEEDPDFVDSDNEVHGDEFDDLLYQQNTVEGLEMGALERELEGDGEGGNVEIDDLEYPSSEELNGAYASDGEDVYRFPEFFVETDMKNPEFKAGQMFSSIKEFRLAIRNYGAINGYNVKFSKANDRSRVEAVCKLGCKWRIWASKGKNTNIVHVRNITPEHTCSRDLRNRHCTYKFLANRYLDTFRSDPDWKTKSIIDTVRRELKTEISRDTAWKTRRLAREIIEGTHKAQFGLLRSYAAEVLRTNSNSTVIIATKEHIFDGIYICFNVCKEGFKRGCRKLIGLDGCHLTGNYGGQLLTAVALDANDCIYPVAYAVVEREYTVTWRWFMLHLGEDLEIDNSNDWTFMTDRQKGLENVINELFPVAEHRFCVRHMYTNFFKKGYNRKELKDFMWRAAKSTTVADFRLWLEKINNVDDKAYLWLMKKNPIEWTKSHFAVRVKSDILLNNGCEVFNKTLLEDRSKSILSMLTSIQTTFMRRIQVRRDKMRRYTRNLCPRIWKKLEKNIAMAYDCTLEWSGGPHYQVKRHNDMFVVDLENRTCACRRWDLTGIPCCHAIACIQDMRMEPQDYVHSCYTVETYLNCYENIIKPINGEKLWPEVDAPTIEAPTWKVPKKGRQQKKRRRQAEEDFIGHSSTTSFMRRKGQVAMTCSVCGLEGHNMRYHSRPDAPKDDWFNAPVEPIETEREMLINKGNKDKLVPSRGIGSSPNQPEDGHLSNQPEDVSSRFQFMPTPGIGNRYDDGGDGF